MLGIVFVSMNSSLPQSTNYTGYLHFEERDKTGSNFFDEQSAPD
jgi:hypothetical protein